MNEPSINSCSTNDLPRCQHRTRTDRRCRHAVSNAAAGLCSKHLHSRPIRFEESDLSAALIGQLTELKSASDLNQVLCNLFRLLSQDRIAARRAAVLAYIGNLLLRTLPAIEHETNPQDEQQWIMDLPRPRRDDSETSDTLALIRNISSANCNQGMDAPGKKHS